MGEKQRGEGVPYGVPTWTGAYKRRSLHEGLERTCRRVGRNSGGRGVIGITGKNIPRMRG